MKRALLVAAFTWVAVGVVIAAGQAPRPTVRRVATAAQAESSAAPRAQAAVPALPVASPDEAKALVGRYCVGCHNARSNTPAANPLVLDNVDYAHPEANAVTWERVIRKLSVGAMPPQGMPHPESAALTAFTGYLTTTLEKKNIYNKLGLFSFSFKMGIWPDGGRA